MEDGENSERTQFLVDDSVRNSDNALKSNSVGAQRALTWLNDRGIYPTVDDMVVSKQKLDLINILSVQYIAQSLLRLKRDDPNTMLTKEEDTLWAYVYNDSKNAIFTMMDYIKNFQKYDTDEENFLAYWYRTEVVNEASPSERELYRQEAMKHFSRIGSQLLEQIATMSKRISYMQRRGKQFALFRGEVVANYYNDQDGLYEPIQAFTNRMSMAAQLAAQPVERAATPRGRQEVIEQQQQTLQPTRQPRGTTRERSNEGRATLGATERARSKIRDPTQERRLSRVRDAGRATSKPRAAVQEETKEGEPQQKKAIPETKFEGELTKSLVGMGEAMDAQAQMLKEMGEWAAENKKLSDENRRLQDIEHAERLKKQNEIEAAIKANKELAAEQQQEYLARIKAENEENEAKYQSEQQIKAASRKLDDMYIAYYAYKWPPSYKNQVLGIINALDLAVNMRFITPKHVDWFLSFISTIHRWQKYQLQQQKLPLVDGISLADPKSWALRAVFKALKRRYLFDINPSLMYYKMTPDEQNMDDDISDYIKNIIEPGSVRARGKGPVPVQKQQPKPVPVLKGVYKQPTLSTSGAGFGQIATSYVPYSVTSTASAVLGGPVSREYASALGVNRSPFSVFGMAQSQNAVTSVLQSYMKQAKSPISRTWGGSAGGDMVDLNEYMATGSTSSPFRVFH